MSSSALPTAELRQVLSLTAGTFMIGTQGFIIAGVLPSMAQDLATPLNVTGQVVTVFAFAYAVSSPVITTLTAGIGRRRLLLVSLLLFGLAGCLAALSQSFVMLIAAYLVLAMAAGTYVPAANALAGLLVTAERRGKALAIVNAGFAGSLAIGVPLGVLVADQLSWRIAFLIIGLLSCAAAVHLALRLPPTLDRIVPAATLRERMAVLRMGRVGSALIATIFAGAAGYAVYPFLATYLNEVAGIEGASLAITLLAYGIAAVVGVYVGGYLADRFGPRPLPPLVAVYGLALAALSAAAYSRPGEATLPLIFGGLIFWSLTAWAFHPAQQARLMGMTDLKLAAIVLSLNASCLYLGFALGAFAGSLTLRFGSVADLGWLGGLIALAALPFSLTPAKRRLNSAEGASG